MTNELPLVTEGKWSVNDSHYVIVGSTTWREPPLPLTAGGEIIGKITRVWREGSVIMGEFELISDDAQKIKAITVDTMNGAYRLDEDSGGVVIDHPEIAGGCGWPDNKYIWRASDV